MDVDEGGRFEFNKVNARRLGAFSFLFERKFAKIVNGGEMFPSANINGDLLAFVSVSVASTTPPTSSILPRKAPRTAPDDI